jgi:phosphoglycerate dehydrogenase-like enzyme
MKPTLVCLDRVYYDAMHKLLEVFKVEDTSLEVNPDDYDYVWTGLTPVETKRVVASPCTGIDHIKSPHVIHLDQEFKGGEGEKVTSTAEHTWSLLLQTVKKKRMQLSGKILGVIGCGRIGHQVAKYGDAFGMSVYVTDIHTQDIDVKRLFNWSDIISIHVPLNEQTLGMVGKEQFDIMKPGRVLINTSRADIVNQGDLYNKMKEDSAFYYADDFSNPLRLVYPHRIVTTNHIGGNCHEARRATDMYVANKLIEYVRGE